MSGRKALVGVCLLSAFVFAAVTQSASAGTWFTCAKEGSTSTDGMSFATEHCKAENGTGLFHHWVTPNGSQSGAVVNNNNVSDDTTAKVSSFFHVVITGIEAELKAVTVAGSGFIENKEEGGEMVAHAVGSITYSEVTVVKPEGCSVEGGKVVTAELTAKSVATGLKFQPKEGTTFAEFNIIGASCPEAIKGNYKVTGSIIGTTSGTTVSTTRAGSTEQATLKARNIKAGLDGKLTDRHSGSGIPIGTT